MFLSGCSNPNSENKSSTPAEQTLPESSFKILILGDSLTEFGITEEEAYPLLGNLLIQNPPQTGKTYHVINGVLVEQLAVWVSRSIGLKATGLPVLALGGNDGLRGILIEEIKKIFL